MKKILLAYATNSGSTKEIADFIAEILSRKSLVDVVAISDVKGLESYEAVVIGAPMILGIHTDAQRFLQKQAKILSKVPYACFFSAMNVTRQLEMVHSEYPVTIDPNVEKAPKDQKHLSLKEKYAKPGNYLKPLAKAFRFAPPKEVAFFAGKLEMFRLKLLQALFVMAIIQAKPGDMRNWSAIESWTNQVARSFEL